MTTDELTEIAIEKLWQMLHDPRLKGCSPYDAARKIGLGSEAAKIVAQRWSGPEKF